MDDVVRGLTRLVTVAPFFTQWTLEAMEDWLREHSPASRVRLSTVTRHNYIYDQIIARAQTCVTPFPILVRKFCRMRWLVIEDGDLNIAVWMKNVQPESLLTTNYPTGTAVKRQRTGRLFGDARTVMFVCGHTIYEDIAGCDAWIDRVILTQEARNADGKRRVILSRPLYSARFGPGPLIVEEPQRTLFAIPIVPAAPAATPLLPTVKPPKVTVKVRRQPAKPADPQSPKVGIEAARRASEEVRRQREQADKRSEGSQGA